MTVAKEWRGSQEPINQQFIWALLHKMQQQEHKVDAYLGNKQQNLEWEPHELHAQDLLLLMHKLKRRVLANKENLNRSSSVFAHTEAK